jgi:hypothetical protein
MDETEMEDGTAFDPALIRRLSRRALCPGMVDQGQVMAVLTRHRGMTAGLPLAEMASRYVDPMPQHPGSTVPIVYAHPAPPGPPEYSVAGTGATAPVSPAPATSKVVDVVGLGSAKLSVRTTTLLRISGAIQVLSELLDATNGPVANGVHDGGELRVADQVGQQRAECGPVVG